MEFGNESGMTCLLDGFGDGFHELNGMTGKMGFLAFILQLQELIQGGHQPFIKPFVRGFNMFQLHL